MIKSMVSESQSVAADTLFRIYYHLLNLVALILGGALLIDVLTEFFPKIKYYKSRIYINNDSYFFSELNERSLALAKSIFTSPEHKRSRLIFTDAYKNTENEASSENFLSAQALGAICIKEDLLHLKIPSNKLSKKWFNKMTYIILIDEDENSNLEALTNLLDKTDGRVKDTFIYIFSSDKKETNIDEEISFIVNDKRIQYVNERLKAFSATRNISEEQLDKMTEEDRKKEEKNWEEKLKEVKKAAKEELDDMMPAVVPINSIKNMTYAQLMDYPLFQPLINREDNGKDKTLNVTILGSGVIGKEFFKNIYWCGQMLNYKLAINVISKDGDIRGWADHVNPEIFKTEMAYDQVSDILKINDKEHAEVYFTYRYFESDVLNAGFDKLLVKKFKDDESRCLLDSDYFIVALGSDEDNFHVADSLRRKVGFHHMINEQKNRTFISYVIYNSDLCRALNKNPRRNYVIGKKADIYMHAFGCDEELYSINSVFFSEIQNSIFSISDTYESQKSEYKEKKDYMKRLVDIYGYHANLARRIHLPYKEFSCSKKFHETSLFDDFSEKEYEEIKKNEAREYMKYIFTAKKEKDDLKEIHELAWLEHRRWNAFMRVSGFIRPENDFDSYYDLKSPEMDVKSPHKFVALKLHPCIVEYSKKGITAKLDDVGNIITETEYKYMTDPDRMDMLSCKNRDKKGNPDNPPEDFKRWDYPYHAFGSVDYWSVLENMDITGSFVKDADFMSIYTINDVKYFSIDKYVDYALKKMEKEGIIPKKPDDVEIIINSIEDKYKTTVYGVEMITVEDAEKAYEKAKGRIREDKQGG